MGRETRCAAAWGAGEEGVELLRRRELEDVGLVDGAGKLFVVEDVGEVEQGLGGGVVGMPEWVVVSACCERWTRMPGWVR